MEDYRGTGRIWIFLGGTVNRITKAALGGIAGCAFVLGGTQLASGETLLQQVFPGWLTDLETDNVGPQGPMTGAFDSAKAKLKVTETTDGKTKFSLEVREINQDLVPLNHVFGSHLHTGGCKTDDIAGTGPHYQHRLGDLNSEVWFSLQPNAGKAVSRTEVNFVPEDTDGIMSIVIHAKETNPVDGKAGDKEVCLPVDVSTIWPLR